MREVHVSHRRKGAWFRQQFLPPGPLSEILEETMNWPAVSCRLGGVCRDALQMLRRAPSKTNGETYQKQEMHVVVLNVSAP